MRSQTNFLDTFIRYANSFLDTPSAFRLNLASRRVIIILIVHFYKTEKEKQQLKF